ncbi:MAG: hypothetical protein AAGF25_14865, partial [Pseudomonadota bacterium]
YDQGFVALENPNVPFSSATWEMRERNLRALEDLEISMNRHLLGISIQDAFHPLGRDIQSAWERISADG